MAVQIEANEGTRLLHSLMHSHTPEVVAIMKTTIDFPDELLHRVRIVAAQRKTTLRELVLKGLAYAIEHPELSGGNPADLNKKRGAKLLELLDQIRITEPVSRFRWDELYDRQDVKKE